ncbi:MAG: hypothetical protein BVN33_14640 [Proteobacteria bacterium ST_bin13]|nr:MAG: hypothetical protein BVN33_14640 [Proteobacteria bacterium ST_bin13]
MALTPIALGLRSNPGRANADGAARLINCYAEDAGEEGKIRYPVYACEGFASWGSVASGGAMRAMLAFSDTALYVVSGQRLSKFNTAGTETALAAFATSGTVQMVRNRKDPNAQIGIVSSDGLFRIIDTTADTVSTPTVPSGVQFNGIAHVDGYFILTQANGEWYITAIDDGTDIDELDFARAESNPDGIVVPMSRGNEVVLFGQRSTEFWQNTGNTDFPFERSTSQSFGCYAAGTAREIGGTIIFAATNADGAFTGLMMLDGYQANKISTPAMDRAILSETTPANLKAFTYAINGHQFYTITGTSFTWTYDMSTGLVHERASASLSRWRVSEAVQFGTRLIVGDYTNGALYLMTTTVNASSDSVASLSHSNDNGETYIGPRSKTIGGTSNRTQRFRWNRLGQSKEDGKVFKIEITNAVSENGTGVPMTIIPPHVHAYPYPMRYAALYADIVPGSSQNSRPKALTGLAVDAVTVRG